MKTVGSILKEARLAKGDSLEQVETAIKIRAKYLASIEADDAGALPSLSYAKGFIRNYAEYLGVDSRTILAFFRRQTREVPKDTILPKGMVEPLNRSAFSLTPAKFLALLVSAFLLLFLGYLGWQYQTIRRPPALELAVPAQQSITGDKRLEVIGKTDTDATVMVNGNAVLVRDDGRFYDLLELTEGVNKITIVATSRFGKTTTLVRDVGYQP